MPTIDLYELVREQADIIQVVQKDVPDLKQVSPYEFRGTCTLHSGTNPTELVVYVQSKTFRCYACGAGGDVIEWTARKEKSGTRKATNEERWEACKKLADDFGLDAPKKKNKAAEDWEKVQATINVVVGYWHSQLDENLRRFLVEHYGLTDETLDYFQVGYAGGNFLKKLDISLKDAKRTGLVIDSEKGDPLVPLQRRIIFPFIRRGAPWYCAGREITSEHPDYLKDYITAGIDAKYVNQNVYSTKHTYIFKKMMKPLWGCDDIRGAKRILLAEGITDAYLAWQCRAEFGKDWTIVSPATDILPERDAKYISEHAKSASIVICFDRDERGREGAIATGVRLAGLGYEPKLADLGRGETDLNEYLQDSGPKAFQGLLENAIPLSQFWALWLKQQSLTLAEKNKVWNDDILTFAAQRSEMWQQLHIPIMCSILDIKFPDAWDALAKASRKHVEKGVQKVVELLEKAYRTVGHTRTGTEAKLTLWSRKRRMPVDFPLTSPGRIRGLMSPDLDILAEMKSKRLYEGGDTKGEGLIKGAMYHITSLSVPKSAYTKLKSGLHVIGNQLVIISGMRVIAKQQGQLWQMLDEPFVADDTLVECSTEEPEWCDWTVEELNKPFDAAYNPSAIYDILCLMLGTGWEWKHENDSKIIAALAFAYTWNTLFPRKPLVHIRGKSGSGKSTVVYGLLGGASYFEHLGGPFIQGARREQNVTEAGILSRFSHTNFTLLLDEAKLNPNPISKRDKALVDVLSLLRMSGESGVESLRGTAEGGWRSNKLTLGCMIASIKSWEGDPEMRRWLILEPKHVPKLVAPARSITEAGILKDIDVREMRRVIMLAWQDNFLEVQQRFQELQQAKHPGEDDIGQSQRDNAMPIIAALSFLDKDWKPVQEQFYHDKAEYELQREATAVEERLVELIVNAKWGRDEQESIRRFIDEAEGLVFQAPASYMADFGVVVVDEIVTIGRQTEEKRVVYVNPGLARRNGPLARTEFQNESDRAIISLLSNHPSFIDTGFRKQFGSVQVRWTRLDWGKIE